MITKSHDREAGERFVITSLITVCRNKMVGLAADVIQYLIVLILFASRDKEAVRCFKRLYIFHELAWNGSYSHMK